MNNQPCAILSRRELLTQASTALGSAVLLGVAVRGVPAAGSTVTTPWVPNVYIAIPPRGPVEITVHRSEMGQNIRTTCAMLVAEELQVTYEDLVIIQAPGNEIYGDQNTDGSRSVRYNWLPLRMAGAAAREVLLQAAGKYWGGLPVSKLVAQDGRIYQKGNRESVSFQELLPLAQTLVPPQSPTMLSGPGHFSKVGKPRPSLDLPAMVTGKTVYGIDVYDQGLAAGQELWHAVLARAPTLGGEPESFAAKPLLAMPGVQAVFALPAWGPAINTNAAIAIVATSTHAALQARQQLKVAWRPGAKVYTNSHQQQLAASEALKRDGAPQGSTGDFDKAWREAPRRWQAYYETAYLEHAPLEPLVATAVPQKNRLQIWAPTQDPMRARKCVAEVLGLDLAQITVHVTHLGGGFGRKSQPDFVVEAAQVAWRLQKPVKLLWTREDMMAHSTYHAMSGQSLAAAIAADGQIIGWRHRSGFPSLAKLFSKFYNLGPTSNELQMGMLSMPYVFGNQLQTSQNLPSDVRVGWFRAVCHNFHAFAIESFMDELAWETKTDPIALRLQHLQPRLKQQTVSSFEFNGLRLIKVIQSVKALAGWDKPSPGVALGFACHYSFMSYVAVVVAVAKHADGTWRPQQVFVAADCGIVVNPDTVLAQLQGAVHFGLSAALYGEITVADGVVEQSNFDDYPLLRLAEAPDVVVEMIPSSEHPTGVGEPGVPPIAPALTNALFRATGQRLRSLPIYGKGR